jgi:hypothetical protein
MFSFALDDSMMWSFKQEASKIMWDARITSPNIKEKEPFGELNETQSRQGGAA